MTLCFYKLAYVDIAERRSQLKCLVIQENTFHLQHLMIMYFVGLRIAVTIIKKIRSKIEKLYNILFAISKT